MISGSHYDSLNFLGRDHKKITCTLVSDASGIPRNFVWRGSTNSVEDRGENGDLGVVAP